MITDEILDRIPIEFGNYILIKVYPNFALYSYKGIWNTCFDLFDLGLTEKSLEVRGAKWR